MPSSVFTPLPSPPAPFGVPTAGPPEVKTPPFPAASSTGGRAPVPELPPWPAAGAEATFALPLPDSWPPLAALPAAEPAPPPFFKPTPQDESTPDFTDDDLRAALAPLLPPGGAGGAIGPDALEPMLRAAVRRALAEYSPGSRPFEAPGALDRFQWRLKALFTSRTYDEILFKKTHRFQVDEVFLFDAATLALVSFASCNPARHASVRRVQDTVQRLAIQLRDEQGRLRERIDLGGERCAVTRGARRLVLAAIVRGEPNELLVSDLGFALRRIEERFRERLRPGGPPLLHELQPFLEDCLLIQAPASAA